MLSDNYEEKNDGVLVRTTVMNAGMCEFVDYFPTSYDKSHILP